MKRKCYIQPVAEVLKYQVENVMETGTVQGQNGGNGGVGSGGSGGGWGTAKKGFLWDDEEDISDNMWSDEVAKTIANTNIWSD